nr:unnamed protein product [Callosobruchus analis]
MKLHYNPEPLEIAEIFRFLQRKQHEGESAQEYLTALQRLATTCKFGDYLKKALRNQFVFGLRAQNIQSRLLEQKDLTVDRALEIAVSMETSARDAAQLHRGTAVHNVGVKQKVNTTVPKVKKNTNFTQMHSKGAKSNFKCFRCGSPDHLANTCPKKHISCYKCKQKGHLGSVCMKSKGSGAVDQVENACEVGNASVDEILSVDEHSIYREKFTLQVSVNKVRVTFEIDSGAAVTLMNNTDFYKLFPGLELQNTEIKLITYSKQMLDVIGFTPVTVKYGTITKNLNLYIINSNKQPLLGREWIRQLNITLDQVSTVTVAHSEDTHINKLFNKYSVLFKKDMGKITGLQATLKLKENIQPFFIKARKVPYALLPKVEKELDFLEKEGVLEKVHSSEYATPIVPVIKANGGIRICGDFKCTLNPNLVIDEYPLPTVEALFASMAGGEKFTKLDLQQAYLQMEVRPQDRKYLTLSTPKGLYRSTRLMYGIASAPAIWQREMENILKDISGVSVFLDDIKITGPDNSTHLERLEAVLSRLASHNVRVNFDKCQFFANQIEYCGYIIDKYGVHKTKEKMDAIQNAKTPSNKTEVRAFLGLVNYYNRFLQNLSTTLHPIYNLLKDNVPFKWDQKCQKAFTAVKQEIVSDRVLAHFDPQLPLVLATDASPYAVGAVLSHVYPDGTERPIQFASQTLSKVQQKYSQIDKEAYAIIFGIKKFFYYLYGRKFTLFVDHQPLVQIFSPSKSLPTLSNTRMQHYALFLQGFTYNIKYKNTKSHSNADFLSRLPMITNERNDQKYDVLDQFEISQVETLPITLKELEQETNKDTEFQKLLNALKTGKLLRAQDRFNIPQIEFSLQHNCIFRQQMAVIPRALQSRVLKELHSAHFGVTKMKALARSYCWWPGISHDLEIVAKNCTDCNKIKNNPPKVLLHQWETPQQPFDRIHIDFAGPFRNQYYLILVDTYTRWPEIHIVKDISTKTTITTLRRIFATYGIPRILVSDNGSSFVSYDFKRFLQENGIIHKLSAPYHPATNGMAERCVQTFKQSLRALKGDNISKQLDKFLLHYRVTQHCITGVSPAFLMFGRDIRTRLDFLKPQIKSLEHTNNNITRNVREFSVGERVECRDYIHSDKWEFGRVTERVGKLHYLVRLDDGRIWKRHVDQMISIGENVPIQAKNDVFQPGEGPINPHCSVSMDKYSKSETANADLNIEKQGSNIKSNEQHNPVIESTSITNDQPSTSSTAIINPTNDISGLRRSKRIIKAPQRLDL